jgi:hypothetical protein
MSDRKVSAKANGLHTVARLTHTYIGVRSIHLDIAVAESWQPTDANGLTGVDPQVILQRYAEGELLRDIAKDYGVSRSAVSHYIARHVPKLAWMDVRKHSMAARLEESIHEMRQAQDGVTLARAREEFNAWRWRAERELPDLYAARPQTAIQVNGAGDLQVNVVSYATHDAVQTPILPPIEHKPQS